MSKNKVFLEWEVGYAEKPLVAPSIFFPAEVPGAVQLDVARALQYPPLEMAENYKAYDWMEDKYWFYRAFFDKPIIKQDEILHLVANGIDFQFSLFINREKIWEQTGMYQPVKLKLEKLQEKNEVMIVIHPVPKVQGAPKNRRQAAQTTKPAVSYGWDFHPRLIPLGICDEIFLWKRKKIHLSKILVEYNLNDQLDEAEVSIHIKGEDITGQQIHWLLKDSAGKVVMEDQIIASDDQLKVNFTLHEPQLWWPHDQGYPHLYTLTFSLVTFEKEELEKVVKKIGFKKVRLVMNEGAWNEPSDFPKSRSIAPATIEINGRKLFAKGTNWVNPDIFYGRISRTTYLDLLTKAKKANFNIIRVWGGGPVNKSSFYQLCDELGLMVWQDFPLACNDYEASNQYMQILKNEATAIVKRLMQHVSLAIWCGGNELFNNWSGMTDQSPALRLLNSLTYRFTPDIPFLPTSPLMGMGHGHYTFADESTGEDVFTRMKKYVCSAYPEFGMPAPASEEVLKTIIPAGELYPIQNTPAWKSHHAFDAWIGDTWLGLGTIKKYFADKLKELGDVVKYGQLLQAEGLKCVYEEARRQKPYCSMALHWCYNEPWPAAANNSIISWPNIPKPGYKAAGDACRPILASLSFPKFCWYTNEILTIDLWLLNDSYQNVPNGTMHLYLEDPREVHLLSWQFGSVGANQNRPGPTARLNLQDLKPGLLQLKVIVDENPNWTSRYYLMLKKAETIPLEDTLNI